MRLTTVTTKQKSTPPEAPKNTRIKSTKPSTKTQLVASSLLDPTISPYDLLSERIDSVNRKIDSVEKNVLVEIKAMNTRVDATNTRIDALDEKLTTRIDATNTRIASLEKSVSRGYVIIGIGIAFVGLISTIGFGFLGFLISKSF